MKIQMLVSEQDEAMFYPAGCIRHVDDWVGKMLIDKGQARRVDDDARARIVPYDDNFCVPLTPPRRYETATPKNIVETR